MGDEQTNGEARHPLASKKFIGVILMLLAWMPGLALQHFFNYKLALQELDPVVEWGLLLVQYVVIGALCILWMGGQQALDAFLGWAAGTLKGKPGA